MPQLPIIKDRELLAALSKLGFFEDRQRATSHLVLKHADGRRIVVAMHAGKDIPRKTLHGMIRDTGISSDELTEALRK